MSTGNPVKLIPHLGTLPNCSQPRTGILWPCQRRQEAIATAHSQENTAPAPKQQKVIPLFPTSVGAPGHIRRPFSALCAFLKCCKRELAPLRLTDTQMFQELIGVGTTVAWNCWHWLQGNRSATARTDGQLQATSHWDSPVSAKAFRLATCVDRLNPPSKLATGDFPG
jgi:hypothetical protein